jgi:zinc transport system substrate-binding protein
MSGIAEPKLIVDGLYSPHNYTLKPKNAVEIQSADLIFWGGREIEPFLIRSLQNLSKTTTISISELDNLEKLPLRNIKQHQHHTESGIDPHLWLDPINAIHIIKGTVTELSSIDPDNSSLYQRNGKDIIVKLELLHTQLTGMSEEIRDIPFMVYHDSYQYFEHRYQLKSLGVMVQNINHASSAGRLALIRKQLVKNKVRCLFSEPQFSDRLVKVATDGITTQIGSLDPIGARLIPGPELYFNLMDNLINNLSSCLKK